MQIQKECITNQFYEYYIYDFPMNVKEISENKFDVNYSKLVELLYEERCKRYNQPIKDNTKKTVFTDYIKTKNFMSHIIYYMETHNIDNNLNHEVKFTSVSDFCEKTNGLFYQEKGYAQTQGTYGPYDFINCVLIDFKPEIIFEYINELKQDIDILNTRVNNYLNIIFNE